MLLDVRQVILTCVLRHIILVTKMQTIQVYSARR